jgi:hypothetical protein
MVVIALTTAMVVVDRGDAHIVACRWWKASGPMLVLIWLPCMMVGQICMVPHARWWCYVRTSMGGLLIGVPNLYDGDLPFFPMVSW